MTSKFEQLIELVINEDEAKAKELFHDIVVEKSREIYESLMQEEEEAEELDEAEEDSEETDEAEELDETFGGDASDDLIDDVEAEEQGMQESEEEFDDEAEEDGEDLTHDMEKDHDAGEDLEDRVVDLEDKLDELMAEFESLMGAEEAEHGDAVGDMDGGDALEMDDTDTAEFNDMDEMSMMENITLAAAPKPTTSEPAGTNTKSTVAFNSGAAGMEGAPVKMTGDTAKGRPAPSTQAVSSDKYQNAPATGSKKLSPATKPHLAQATGVNTKTPFPKG
jgi:hypothetical protein